MFKKFIKSMFEYFIKSMLKYFTKFTFKYFKLKFKCFTNFIMYLFHQFIKYQNLYGY